MKKLGNIFSNYTDRANTRGGTRKYVLGVLYKKEQKRRGNSWELSNGGPTLKAPKFSFTQGTPDKLPQEKNSSVKKGGIHLRSDFGKPLILCNLYC